MRSFPIPYNRYTNYLRSLRRESQVQSREVKFFFFSQYFADGLRMTLAILLPSLVFAYNGDFDLGLTLSMGAFCVSLTDTPGPIAHKRNGMLFCCLFIWLSVIVTGFARMNNFTLGLEVLLMAFICSMFLVYGSRAGSVGSAALLVMILFMDTPLTPPEIFKNSAYLLAGGLWYVVVSLIFSQIRPYRPAQRALGECIHEIAKFLRIKAEFYSVKTDLDEDYRKLVAQQVTVSEKQDAVRELLFKSRMMVKDANSTSKLLILTFLEIVDLFDDVMATYYDYATIREKFTKTGVLDNICSIIKKMATELDNIGFSIQANAYYKKQHDLDTAMIRLKACIDAISETEHEGSLVLKKVFVNIKNLNHRIDNILVYFAAKNTQRVSGTGNIDYSRFVTHQNFSFKVLRDNLSFNSAIFKHSLRMALVCLVGFVVTKFMAYGEHSYWVLLTIAFILKPAFSLTKQRNVQRIIGTIVGGIIGVVILLLVKDNDILLMFLLLFMLGTYSFMRMNYILMVIFTTPYVLILLNFLGESYLGLAQERVLDTLVGCAIAFTASYLIFPTWESEQINALMHNVLKDNIKYMHRLAEMIAGRNVNIADYKLARKDIYVSSANLSAAFQRMLSEPKNKQKNSTATHQFVVLNHTLTSNIATITSGFILKDKQKPAITGNLKPIRQSLMLLYESMQMLDPAFEDKDLIHVESNMLPKDLHDMNAEEKLQAEQLEFIHKVSNDIKNVTERFTVPQEISEEETHISIAAKMLSIVTNK
ncbi:MAG: FUSC family membrane protein [Bacteroidia bacterium]